MKMLIVEDEPELRKVITSFFEKSGNIVVNAVDKFEAEDKLLSHQFDIVVLDITLPDGSGLNVIPIIRKSQTNSGVLILSAKNSLDDKIEGLDLGADDYLTKPFQLSELNSRVNAIIRRKQYQGDDVIRFKEISINHSEKQVYINDTVVALTNKEFTLLLFFITNQKRVLTKESIAEHLWGEDLDFLENFDFIYTHIKNMRKKIENAGGNDYLKTIHGLGYKYDSL